MKKFLLERKPTTATECEGFLSFGKTILATIERPWLPHPDQPGGTPFQSCIPDGTYELRPHTRPSGKESLALINPALGVYYEQHEVPDDGGRYLILIHAGNWVTDIVGCIAPGLSKGDSPQGRMVKSSAVAMQKVLSYAQGDDAELTIKWIS